MSRRITDRQFGSSGVYDIDVAPVTVSGAVTVAGSNPRDSATGNPRGTVPFEGPGGAVSDELGTSGPAEFDARLSPDSYDVTLANGSDCPDDGSQAFPCQSRTGGATCVSCRSAKTLRPRDRSGPCRRLAGVAPNIEIHDGRAFILHRVARSKDMLLSIIEL